MVRLVLFIAIALVPFKSIYAEAIDFTVGSDMAELGFLTQSSSFGYGGADIGLSALVNEHNDVLLSGTVLVSGSSTGDVNGLHFGVGAKVYVGFLDGPKGVVDTDGAAIAIGGQVRYVFSGSTPMAVYGEGYFAPEVTSIAEMDGMSEFRLGFEIEITPSARAYIGYRNLEVTYDERIDYEIDDAAHVGVRFEF